jgi:hypothetical protein
VIRLVVVGALVLAFAADALACSCLPVDLPRDLPLADGAIIGTILERHDRETSSTLLFRVEQVYKGDIDNRVEIVTPRGSTACGIDSPVGERLGLLLQRDGSVWRSNLCSQVDPAAFLALTNVEDNTLPPTNWGGIVVGVLVLGGGAYFLWRRLRRNRVRGS